MMQSDQELTPKQLHLLLERRGRELHTLRQSYITELTLLRAQLFNVKQKQNVVPSLPFQLETNLELLSSITSNPSTTATTTTQPQIKQLKQLIAKSLSNQSCKTDLILETLTTKLNNVINQNDILTRAMTTLELTGKPELNRQIKQLRMRGLRMGAEAERKMTALRTSVKESQQKAEASERRAAAIQLGTKEGVKTIFQFALLNINKYEKRIKKRLNKLEDRLNTNTTQLGKASRIISLQHLKRESIELEKKKKKEETKLQKEIEQNALETSMEIKKQMQEEKAARNVTNKTFKESIITNIDGSMNEKEEEREEQDQEEKRETPEEENEIENEIIHAHETDDNDLLDRLDADDERQERNKGTLSSSSSLQDMECYLKEFEQQQLQEEMDTSIEGDRDAFTNNAMMMSQNVRSTFPSPPSGFRKSPHRTVSPRNRSTSLTMASSSSPTRSLPKASFLGFYDEQNEMNYSR